MGRRADAARAAARADLLTPYSTRARVRAAAQLLGTYYSASSIVILNTYSLYYYVTWGTQTNQTTSLVDQTRARFAGQVQLKRGSGSSVSLIHL